MNTCDNQNTNKKRTFSSDSGKSETNVCLLFFEFLACCLIVFVHCSFPGYFGIIMNSTARFGVPLFFAISGFYLYKKGITKEEVRAKLKKRIIRISFLLLFSFLLYFTLGFFASCFGENSSSFIDYLESIFNWKSLVLLVVCNNPLTNVINWFMIALLFTYFIIYLFPNLFMNNNVFCILISCFAFAVLLLRVLAIITNASLFGVSLSAEYLYRSWYANGLLFVCLGIVIKKYETAISKMNTYVILSFLFVSFIVMIIEQLVMYIVLGKIMSYYIGSIGCVASIISLSIKRPNWFSKLSFLKGHKDWTTYIYIFHYAVIICLSFLFSLLNIKGTIIDWMKPIFVLTITIFIAMFFSLTIDLIKKRIGKSREARGS